MSPSSKSRARLAAILSCRSQSVEPVAVRLRARARGVRVVLPLDCQPTVFPVVTFAHQTSGRASPRIIPPARSWGSITQQQTKRPRCTHARLRNCRASSGVMGGAVRRSTPRGNERSIDVRVEGVWQFCKVSGNAWKQMDRKRSQLQNPLSRIKWLSPKLDVLPLNYSPIKQGAQKPQTTLPEGHYMGQSG
jgi:hypothetical protein